MGVFRFELKQYKTSIIIWALSLSLAIIFLLPIFSGMLPEDKSSVLHSLQDNPVMEAMGISAENFFSLPGIYAFLSSFLMLAASIHAINLGLSIITKEHMQNTADFLMTKPYSRTQIFLSKMAAALCAIFMIAIAYCIGGFVAMFIVTGGGFDNTIFTLLRFRLGFFVYIKLKLRQDVGLNALRLNKTKTKMQIRASKACPQAFYSLLHLTDSNARLGRDVVILRLVHSTMPLGSPKLY